MRLSFLSIRDIHRQGMSKGSSKASRNATKKRNKYGRIEKKPDLSADW